jgi:selenocysteine lyase/cysteine desulfurase
MTRPAPIGAGKRGLIPWVLDREYDMPRVGPISALLPTVGAGQLVPLAPSGAARYVNLDTAASAPALVSVRAAVDEALAWYSSVHRGAGYLSQVSTGAYEDARNGVRQFVGGRPDDVVVFTRNTTDSLNLLADAVPGTGRVLVLDIEHHANLLPWRRGAAVTLTAATSVAGTLRRIAEELRRQPYALLAVTGLSNVSGEALPVAELANIAHRHGARVAVDGAQLVPHGGVSMAAQGIDYLALSGHKLYAPFGAGALIGTRDWLDEAPPYLAGGGAVRRVGLDSVEWTVSPARHEAGTPNTVGAVALAAACRALAKLGFDRLADHERTLTARLTAGLATISGIRVARIWPDSPEPRGIVTFALAGLDPAVVAAALSAEHGIGVRDGRFCAHPLLERLGFPAGAVRASIGVHTSSDDIDRLLHGLRAIAANGPALAYRLDESGSVVPVDDPRRLPPHLGSALLGVSVPAPCLT